MFSCVNVVPVSTHDCKYQSHNHRSRDMDPQQQVLTARLAAIRYIYRQDEREALAAQLFLILKMHWWWSEGIH